MKDSHQSAPLAIVGIGLRFPGNAEDVSSFWKLMNDKVDAIQTIPKNRWNISKYYHPTPGMPGKTYSKWGAFIEGYDRFDASFFNISSAEAESMDPQQRLLLEASWHAIEDSGEIVEKAKGENIGVFVGVSTRDYEEISLSTQEVGVANAYSATGNAKSITANRISHALNLKGPSVAFDTACSSSLVALHYACQSLQAGECDRALVGGVNFIFTPSTWIAFCGMSALSKDGRCKAFDASADGFVRGEGVGVVMLKPLAKALADGDRIYACVRATGCNQDGRTPAISMPDQIAQENLIRHTLDRAGLKAEDICYVEAHGTGTAVGDPIEARAIGTVLGKNRDPKNPLLMGSVKTNIGHLESGAGIASLIKSALVLQHRQVPPNLHFKEGNPAIPFADLNLTIPTELTPLASVKQAPTLFASINSFGFGGTNAHAIIESAPSPSPAKKKAPASAPSSGRPGLYALSAQSDNALKALSRFHTEKLATDPEAFASLSAQLLTQRNAHRHRLLVSGDTPAAIKKSLENWLKEEADPNVVTGSTAPGTKKGVAFVFSGQGSQWFAMGRELLQSNAVFAQKIQECHDLILKLKGFNLLEELQREENLSQINKTEIAQPAIFAVQVALVDVWRAWGITPSVVVGHSVGEVAAAHVAGALTLEEAVRVIFYRGDTMKHASGGKMIAVGVSAEAALKAIEAYGERLALAAVNSPSSVSISGEPEALGEIFPRFEAQGVFCRYVPVDYAFHSAQMNPVEKELKKALSGLAPGRPTLPIYSTVTGEAAPDETFDADYWWRNVRQTVRFADAIRNMIEDGNTAFLEIGSHPVLRPSLKQCADSAEARHAVVVHSLHRKEAASHSLFTSLATLHCTGYAVDLARNAGEKAPGRDLPLYPFDRESYWKESPYYKNSRLEKNTHPFMATKSADVNPSWNFLPEAKLFSYLHDHLVDSKILMPGAGFLEMGLALAHEVFTDKQFVLEEVTFKQALVLAEGSLPPTIRTAWNKSTSSFQVFSCGDSELKNWTLHAEGGLRPTRKKMLPAGDQVRAAQARCLEKIEAADFYASAVQINLQYGPYFQGIREVYAGNHEAFARVEIPMDKLHRGEDYFLHPSLLDSAFQTILAAIPREVRDSADGPYLPAWVNRLRFEQKAGGTVLLHTRLTSFNREELEADITLIREDGETVARIEGFRCHRLKNSKTQKPYGMDVRLLQVQWERQALKRDTDPTPPHSFFPAMVELSKDVRQKVEALEAAIDPSTDPRVYEHLYTLCATYIEKAFIDLGLQVQAGDVVSWQDLSTGLGVHETHHRVLRHLLRHLVQAGVFSPIDEDTWEVLRPLSADGLAPALQRWLKDQPGGILEANLAVLVGEQMAAMLKGELSVLQILFSQENAELTERFYSEALSSRTTNYGIAETVRALSLTLPRGRRLRILEIGAGTSATTRHYLPTLPAGSYELTFTDVSEAFFLSAEKKLLGYPDIVYRTLDISKSPLDQGFTASYDLIIAADVIHATPRLRETFRNVRELLRPGGLFVMADLTVKHSIYFDMIFGLAPGAWIFEDLDLRPDYLSLEAPEWTNVLTEIGFADVTHVPDSVKPESQIHGVFICREPDRKEPVSVSESVAAGDWLILSDKSGVGTNLATILQSRGQRTQVVTPAEWINGGPAILEKLAGLENLRGAVYLGAFDLPAGNESISTRVLEDSQELTIHQPAALVRSLTAQGSPKLPGGLWLVTRGALKVLPEDKPDILHSPLQGLGRSIFSEIRDLPFRLADLSATVTPFELELLADELLGYPKELPRDEDQIVFRGEGRFVPRVIAAAPTGPAPVQEQSVHEHPCRVTSTRFGVLDALCLETIERRLPGPGEVEVQINAAGMNFRDVMKALRIYPTNIGDAEMLGDEFAGVVVQVGEGVSRFRCGDRIAGVAMGSFRSHWTGSEDNLCHLPDGFTFESGATLLTAYTTAYLALHEIGRMKKGERVLIHSAAGGVGIAAVRLAQIAGAEVFATAGNRTKEAILRQMGVRHVFNSRNLEFADEIMEVTNREGIDIVLNSLAGEAIPKSLGCLRQGGRFLEIGKRDIYENSRLGLRPFMNGLSFSSIDLAAGMHPEQQKDRMALIERLLDEGVIQPLPFGSFSFSQPSAVFRNMSQGKHIGKLVLNLQGQHARPLPAIRKTAPTFSSKRTVFISGGTRGLGLSLAAWFLKQGSRHLVLVSRSGQTPENQALADFLTEAQKMGATVLVKAIDIADEAKVDALLNEVRATLPPLGTIVHSAFVLADELFLRMTREQFTTGIQTKVSGAWNLHRLTQKDPIEQFLLLSSLASIMANPGQANYVAANTFVEQLAHRRRALNQPALVVNLDMIRDTGFVARNTEVGDYLLRMGWEGVTSAQVIEAIGILLANHAVMSGVYRTNLSKTATLSPHLKQLNRFKALLEEDQESGDEEQTQRIRREILNAAPEKRMELIENFLCEQIGKVLRTPAKSVSKSLPLNQQGLDSLMAVELITLLEQKLAVTIPTNNLMNAPTVTGLGAAILTLLTGETVQVSTEPASPDSAQPGSASKFPILAESETPEEDLARLLPLVRDTNLHFGMPKSRKRLLLTGASGFLGIYLLREFLQSTDSEITCMVRGKDLAEAEAKLRSACQRYHFDWKALEKMRSRWSLVCGDLSLENLGLSPESHDALANGIDVIVHCGAQVSHISTYHLLRQSNVLGTLELIRLAGTGTPKVLHFASSVAVYDRTGLVKTEEQAPDALEEILEGYGQTKAVCEHLIAEARQHGLAATSYRIGPVVGDETCGISAHHDIIWLMLKACVLLGIGPNSDWNLYLTPVDYISRVMVKSVTGNITGKTIHGVNLYPVTMNHLLKSATRHGYEIELVPVQEWIRQLREADTLFDFSSYLVFRKELVDGISGSLTFPELSHTELDQVLAQGKISTVRMDEKRIDFYFDFLIESEFLPSPVDAA